jgi:hypothetical protein
MYGILIDETLKFSSSGSSSSNSSSSNLSLHFIKSYTRKIYAVEDVQIHAF